MSMTRTARCMQVFELKSNENQLAQRSTQTSGVRIKTIDHLLTTDSTPNLSDVTADGSGTIVSKVEIKLWENDLRSADL